MYFKRNPVILDPEMQLCATAFNSKKKLTRWRDSLIPVYDEIVIRKEIPVF